MSKVMLKSYLHPPYLLQKFWDEFANPIWYIKTFFGKEITFNEIYEIHQYEELFESEE